MATVNVLLSMLGDKTPSPSDDPSPKDEDPNQRATLKNRLAQIKKLAGIQFGMSALLKQSQVFTSIIGTIFQLLGALIDVILGPFMPFIVKGVMFLAKMIPHVAKAAQWVVDKLGDFFDWMIKARDNFGGAMNDAKSYLGGILKDLPGKMFDWLTKDGPVADISRRIAQYATIFPRFRAWLFQQALKMPMRILRGLANGVLPGFGGKVIDLLMDGIKFVISGAKDWIKGLLQKLISKGGELIGKIPMFGKLGAAISKVAGGVGAFGKVAKAVAVGSKAVPVIGSLATLGFGAAETYRAYKKYGLGWETAAYAGKTLAATGLTLSGNSMAGLAVDLGGTAALSLLIEQEHNDGTRTTQEVSGNSQGRVQRNSDSFAGEY